MNYLERKISNAHRDYVDKHGKEPEFAVCHIVWKDDYEDYDVKIALKEFDVDTVDDDSIFFYAIDTSGLYSLIANIDEPIEEVDLLDEEEVEMINASIEDFAIIEFHYFI